MKRIVKIIVLLLIVLAVWNCHDKQAKPTETILEGKASILVDETLMPIAQDQVDVFESQYNAKITLIPRSEAEAINALVKDSAKIAILSRTLTPEENKVFQQKNIVPRITKFATDAITLIRNKNSNDTLIALDDILEFLRGKTVKGISGMAFDNPNSSTASYMCQLAEIKTLPANTYSFHNNSEAIKYIAEHDGMIGIIGLNWIVQPEPSMRQYLDKINVMEVKGKDAGYYSPTQNNIAEGKYPLARELFVANCQGYSGLGMGFASFIAGERGQRIILKSGLLPATIPGRKILIRNTINKDK